MIRDNSNSLRNNPLAPSKIVDPRTASETRMSPAKVGKSSSNGNLPSVAFYQCNVVLDGQKQLISLIANEFPAKFAFGDILGTVTNDFNPKRQTLLISNSTNRSESWKMSPEMAEQFAAHINRVKQSPFSEPRESNRLRPLFLDTSGKSFLTFGVTKKEPVPDLAVIQLGLNVAGKILHEARQQLAPKNISLLDILKLGLDDIEPNGYKILIKDDFSDIIGQILLSDANYDSLKSYRNIMVSSLFRGFWEHHNPHKPLFMTASGQPMSEFF